ncbi:MAG: Stk1 family PASTA domain-containing Ser/Thr kinase [Anaerorhabdus sp.]
MKKTIANRYILTKHIGQGGMADVYIAVDVILNREVAVKILRGELSNDPVALLRFQREASASTALSHPNIVDIYDVGEDEGTYFIVMEYVVGKTLKQLIHQRGALYKEEALDIMKQLVGATTEAHKRGIIHRDIKPQNVLVKDDGTIKMVDFGIALAQGALQLTQSDSVMGSVHYLAPELARGESATEQSDIYSLGVVFYELITGEVPFQADSAVQVALKHMREEFPSIREFNPSVPQSIENIIIKATVKNKNYRYGSCLEMLNDLSACLKPQHVEDKKLVFTSKAEDNQTVIFNKQKDGTVIAENVTLTPEKKSEKSKKKKEKKSILPIMIITLISLLTIAGVYLLVTLSGILGPSVRTVDVPNLVGLTVTEAKEICSENNLVLDPSIEYQLTDDIENGKIISADPGENTEVEFGTKIHITVSSGIAAYVEDYTGQNIKETKESLQALYPKMIIKTVEEELKGGVPGEIIRQEGMTEGQAFNPSTATTITLVYVKYPSIIIPLGIKGKTVEEAQAMLEELGAEVMLSTMDTSTMSEDEKSFLDYGVVIETSPSIGSTYTQEEGTYIILYYY